MPQKDMLSPVTCYSKGVGFSKEKLGGAERGVRKRDKMELLLNLHTECSWHSLPHEKF